MGASSVTGVSGPGVSGKATLNQLSVLANGPSILLSGAAEAETPLSPDGFGGSVTFPQPLAGAASGYVVILTSENAGSAQVIGKSESGGNFVGFAFAADSEGEVNYIVAKKGIRANAPAQ